MCTHQVGVACKSHFTKCQKSIPPQSEGGKYLTNFRNKQIWGIINRSSKDSTERAD